jgi:hypothetical protein
MPMGIAKLGPQVDGHFVGVDADIIAHCGGYVGVSHQPPQNRRHYPLGPSGAENPAEVMD